PLTHVSEGAEAPLTGSELVPHTVPGDVSEVDVLLGAHVWAHADIETAFTGLSPLISQNHNIARALGMFELHSRNRPAPQAAAEHAEGQSAAPEAEPPTRDRFKGDCYAGRRCDGRVLARRVLHCHNCKRRFSGRSILRPDGTCEVC